MFDECNKINVDKVFRDRLLKVIFLVRCLRCLCVAVPSHLTPTIDLCLDGLENLRGSPEAIYGYSAALAALLGAVR